MDTFAKDAALQALELIEVIERYQDRFHRGEILGAVGESVGALTGLIEFAEPGELKVEADRQEDYLWFIQSEEDRFSDGELISALFETRELIRKLMAASEAV